MGHYALGPGETAELIEQHPQEVPKHKTPHGCEDVDDLCPGEEERGAKLWQICAGAMSGDA